MSSDEADGSDSLPKDARVFRLDNLTSPACRRGDSLSDSYLSGKYFIAGER